MRSQLSIGDAGVEGTAEATSAGGQVARRGDRDRCAVGTVESASGEAAGGDGVDPGPQRARVDVERFGRLDPCSHGDVVGEGAQCVASGA
jgi:hypothetical protein